MKRSVLSKRTNVADRFDFDVLRIAAANQHVAFVAGANHGDSDRIAHLFVTEVGRTKPSASDSSRGDGGSQKIATVNVVVAADGGVVVFLADVFLFGCQFIDHGFVLGWGGANWAGPSMVVGKCIVGVRSIAHKI